MYLYLVHADDAVPLLYVVDTRLYKRTSILYMPMTRYRSCTLLILFSIQTYLYLVNADDAVPLLYIVDARLYTNVPLSCKCR